MPLRWRANLVFAGLCVLFALPRIAGLFSDFWLDEIWALDIVGRIASPLDLFTRVHFDNNHWLYSLYLWAVGPREGWIVYRLPSLAAGIATLPLALAIARRDGEREGGLALLLFGGSFLLIEYASEARGYALAVCFALGAFLAQQSSIEARSVRRIVAVNVCCVLGLLCHLTFLFPYCGLLSWSLARGDVRRALECHALPLLVFAALYFVDVRHMQIGGGPEAPLALVVGDLAALVLGFPDSLALQRTAAGACAVIAVAGLWGLRSDPSRVWVFYLVTLIVAPAAVVATRATDSTFWAARYFLLCVPFLLLLLARVLAQLARIGRTGSALAISLLLLYLAGNTTRVVDFLRFGRGGYGAAVAYMLEHDRERVLTVGSDHDFRNSMLLRYYTRALPSDRELVYVTEDAWPAEGPRWLIVHSLDPHYVPEQSYVYAGRVEYTLAKHFPYAGVSGWHWSLYRRNDRPGRG